MANALIILAIFKELLDTKRLNVVCWTVTMCMGALSENTGRKLCANNDAHEEYKGREKKSLRIEAVNQRSDFIQRSHSFVHCSMIAFVVPAFFFLAVYHDTIFKRCSNELKQLICVLSLVDFDLIFVYEEEKPTIIIWHMNILPWLWTVSICRQFRDQHMICERMPSNSGSRRRKSDAHNNIGSNVLKSAMTNWDKKKHQQHWEATKSAGSRTSPYSHLVAHFSLHCRQFRVYHFWVNGL